MAAAISSGKRSGVQAKAGMPSAAQRRGVAVVEARRAVVAERQQADRPARRSPTSAAARRSISRCVAALVEVGDQDEDGLRRARR